MNTGWLVALGAVGFLVYREMHHRDNPEFRFIHGMAVPIHGTETPNTGAYSSGPYSYRKADEKPPLPHRGSHFREHPKWKYKSGAARSKDY